MHLENHMDDPCDEIGSNDLGGWTYYNDSSRMCKTDNGEGLGGDRGDRYQDSRVRNDNG